MVSVTQIIYGNCVKYDRLKSIIDEAFAGSEANNLNIYVDLYSILKQAFKKEINVENYQGNAVINYTEYDIPYTRIIEHKHFEFLCQSGNEGSIQKTIITKEYPAIWKKGDEPYYPVNNEKNNGLYNKYKELADNEDKVIFGGRLGMYKYFDMDKDIEAALDVVDRVL